jgi:hypothetical protein
MRDTGCPPFRDVAGYLFCFVLSVTMIVYLVPWLLAGFAFAWVFLALFCAVIGYAVFRLGQELFPARFLRCRACSLVRKIIEIDGIG